MDIIKNKISNEFINKWTRRYSEHDEEECDALKKQLPKEIKNGKLSENTFRRVIDWKSKRIKGIIDWDNFTKYQKVLSGLEKLDNKRRLEYLIGLRGIGIPTASVFLHFLWPNEYPIIDIRTVTILNHFDYINWKTINDKNYWIFKERINEIQKNTGLSLRDIDRALFAYHKNNFITI
jgi:thermostable 8-oxoguanine DNA glycosylase